MKNIPINKGQYTMETEEREKQFEAYRAEGWEEEYYEYRRNWEVYPKQQYVSDYPLLVDVELSTMCNLRCPMCFTITEKFAEKVTRTMMSFDLYKRIIDEIAGKVPALRLSLRGESTLHPHFVECIRYAKARGINEISFLTNASNLTDDLIRDIVTAGATWITISIDGVGETYEAIRKPLRFEDTFNKIKAIKRIKDELGMHKPVIKIQTLWPSISKNPSEYYNLFAPYVDLIAFNSLIDYLGNDDESIIVHEPNFSCSRLYQRLVIGADGLVMLCPNDEENTQIIGDVNTETVHDVWHGLRMNQARELHKKEDGFKEIDICRRCFYARLMEDGETAEVNGREFIIQRYINRSQIVGT